MTDRRPDDDLRALFEDAVADVEPAPALSRITDRTKVTTMNSRTSWILAAAGAVAATTLIVVGVNVLGTTGTNRPVGPGSNTSTGGSATGEPSPTPTDPDESPSGDPSDEPVTTEALPVYYVTDTPTGPRLAREFRSMQVPEDQGVRLTSALVEATAGTALDPDYRSGWPDGVSAGVSASAGAVTADLVTVDVVGAPHDLPAGMTADDAEAAVQQLVYTVQAVMQARVPVQLTLDGSRSDRILGVPTSEPLAQAEAMTILAPVWIIGPQEGDTVSSPFTVEGRGAFFEANVSWQLLQGGTVVKEGFTTAQECCTLSPYSFRVDASPGTYTLRVYDADMSDGEGPGEQEDTKTVVVE